MGWEDLFAVAFIFVLAACWLGFYVAVAVGSIGVFIVLAGIVLILLSPAIIKGFIKGFKEAQRNAEQSKPNRDSDQHG